MIGAVKRDPVFRRRMLGHSAARFLAAPLPRLLHSPTCSRDHLRVAATGAGFELQVRRISWDCHVPLSDWLPHHAWVKSPSENEVREAEARAVADKRHFGTCKECGERNVRGHMGGDTCHACMQAAGIVF